MGFCRADSEGKGRAARARTRRSLREMKPWKKGVINSLKIILGAAAGDAIGTGIGMLIKMLAQTVIRVQRKDGARVFGFC